MDKGKMENNFDQQDNDALYGILLNMMSDKDSQDIFVPLDKKPTDKDVNVLIGAVRKVDDSKQVEIIYRLLSTEFDINAKDDRGRAILMHACLQGSMRVVQFLLNHADRLDVFATDNSSNTALMLCCAAGQDHIVGILLNFVQSHFDFNVMLNYLDALNDSDETATTLALKHGHVDCVTVLSKYLKFALDLKERSTTFRAVIDKTAKYFTKFNQNGTIRDKKQPNRSASKILSEGSTFRSKKLPPNDLAQKESIRSTSENANFAVQFGAGNHMIGSSRGYDHALSYESLCSSDESSLENFDSTASRKSKNTISKKVRRFFGGGNFEKGQKSYKSLATKGEKEHSNEESTSDTERSWCSKGVYFSKNPGEE